ncbi:MAG: phosphoheptose isomerase [Rickettsiales bacterium]|nr:phosphoheptose isomerase [Rickettsiales bacterium]
MKKTLEEFFDEQILEHSRVLKKTKETTQQSFIKIVRLCVDIIRNGNKIIFFGNGGSASDSQHLATELCVRFSENRKPISAISLNTDTSVLTAIGNDLGFNHIFSRQIEALGKPNDLVVAISTSGKSKNIIEGLKKSREMQLKTVCFTGSNIENIIAYSDEVISVPAKNTSRIQEMHILLGQMLCNAIESELNLAKFVETEKS